MYTHWNRLDIWEHTTYLHVKENRKKYPFYALWLTLISSNYFCLEHIIIFSWFQTCSTHWSSTVLQQKKPLCLPLYPCKLCVKCTCSRKTRVGLLPLWQFFFHEIYRLFCYILYKRIVYLFIGTRRYLNSGPKVIKLFSCSTQLSMKFFLLINVKMPTTVGILTFMSRKNSLLHLSEPD